MRKDDDMPKGYRHRSNCRCAYCKAAAGPPKRRKTRRKRTTAKGGRR